MEFLTDTWYLVGRLVRASLRMPIFVIISIVQPILWLSLFGQLFRSSAANYVQFLAPGISIMTALFGAAYSGMGLIAEIDRGVLDRLLATPVSRGALMTARIVHASLQVVLQAALILIAGVVLGARPQGGPAGVLMVFLAAALLGAAFAAFSSALALLARKPEMVIAVMNFVVLPMTFLSTMLRSADQIPGWIRATSRLNPVNWAVSVARGGFEGRWDQLLPALPLLAAFALACAALATRAFERYRRAL
jgi:ABC-2 type transport system permease protein